VSSWPISSGDKRQKKEERTGVERQEVSKSRGGAKGKKEKKKEEKQRIR
jgi:hypothetical protein